MEPVSDVVRGSRKMLRALPEAVEEIRVHAEVMGRLRAGPSPSMAGSGVSHLFERNASVMSLK